MSFTVKRETGDDKVNGHVWNSKSTKLLIDLIRRYKGKLHNPKYKKKTICEEMAAEMVAQGFTLVNIDVIDRKIRNLKRTYRSIKDNNNSKKSGRFRLSWEFYDDFEEIYGDEQTVTFCPTINSFTSTEQQSASPETTRSPRTLIWLRQKSSARSTPSPVSSSPFSSPSRSPQFDEVMLSPTQMAKQQSSMDPLAREAVRLRRQREASLAKLHKIFEESNAITRESLKIQEERNQLFKKYLKVQQNKKHK